MRAIVVHQGRAHADDFLAACVCRFRLGLPVFRIPCDSSMLEESDCWVLDQGLRHDPSLHNFDHHQTDAEVCSLTLILDHFYGGSYRECFPGMRYLEILDSHGVQRASEYAKASEEAIRLVESPIHSSMLSAFSRIDGEVTGGFLEVMGMIGGDVCAKAENKDKLLACIDSGYRVLFVGNIKVLDICGCLPPDGLSHADLPTKLWCKARNEAPAVILTLDSRFGGYRMVSINVDSLRFSPNAKAYYTHASGFLVAFHYYDDYSIILSESTK